MKKESKKISILKRCLTSQTGSSGLAGLVLISASVLALIHLTSKSNLELATTLKLTTKMKAKFLNHFVDFKLAQPGVINELRDPFNAPSNNDPLSCSINSTSCLAHKDHQRLVKYLYYSDGSMWMNLANPHTGLTENGEVCTEFDLEEDDIDPICKYRLELRWTPNCKNPACTSYDDVYTGVVFTKEKNGLIVVKDEKKYGISQNF